MTSSARAHSSHSRSSAVKSDAESDETTESTVVVATAEESQEKGYFGIVPEDDTDYTLQGVIAAAKDAEKAK